MYTDRVYCGEISRTDIGKDVLLAGWVDRKRDLGGIVFLEVRDVSGIIQVVFDSSSSQENADIADTTRSEYVVRITGRVRERTEETVNPNLKSGDIEVFADGIEILNTSLVPPISLDSRDTHGEEVRLRYRFLDLRREEMQKAVIVRHHAMRAARDYLSDNRFFEIETPMLNKSTPEGARDFLVPSRMNRGKFYALPQSPQLFKQILMISGFDRYFQIVKCFRDEDLRNDRQPEFTQIDMELSFVESDIIISLVEGLLEAIIKEAVGREVTLPFQRITYQESMDKYGTDAPDLRVEFEIQDCSDIFVNSEFNVFTQALKKGGVVKGIAVPDNGKISRKMIDDYTSHVPVYGAKGFPMFKVKEGKLEGGIAKFIGDEEREKVIERFSIDAPSVVFFSVDTEDVVNTTLAAMRVKIAKDIGMIDEDALKLVWVTDFPLLEYSHEDKRFYAMHHPFTAPQDEFIGHLDNLSPENEAKILAKSYDIVLNGVEIGGGSIRIHRPEIQKKIFSLLGISDEEVNEKFSFLMEALQYGAPPHGGIALGLDRIMMILLRRNSIRDVIPFPKTQKGQCPMSGAPSSVSPLQLKELSLRVVER